MVLIESDWNLKYIKGMHIIFFDAVLIESDWNLKYLAVGDNLSLKDVLIESDWNLKSDRYSFRLYRPGINRIRLEFKGCF